MTVSHEVCDKILKVEQLWHTKSLWMSRYWHESDVVDTEIRLQLSHLEELVEQYIGIYSLLHINHDAHTLTVRLVVDIGNALNLLVVRKLCDVLDQLCLVDSIRYLGSNDALIVAVCLNLCFRTYHDTSATRLISILYAVVAIDDTTCREVRSLDILHELWDGDVWIVDICANTIYYFREIMSRHIGCHTYGNTVGTIDKERRDACWQHLWLHVVVREVWHHIHRVLLYVTKHLFAYLRESCLGVTHCCCTITIDRAEVTLTIDLKVTQVPRLCHADECSIYRAVAMRVVLTEHLTYDSCTFLGWLVICIAKFVHSVQYTAMNRLKAIAHIRKCSCYDDRH